MNDEAKEQVQVRHVEEEEGESINTCSYHGLGQRELTIVCCTLEIFHPARWWWFTTILTVAGYTIV